MLKFGLGKRDIKKMERERDIDNGIAELLYDEGDKVVFEAIRGPDPHSGTGGA